MSIKIIIETMSRAEISVSAGYILVGLIVIIPFTDIVSTPEWLDIYVNCYRMNILSAHGHFKKFHLIFC